MNAEILLLRLVHVLGGLFWIGGGLFTTVFFFPALAVAGPARGAILGELQRRRLFIVIPVVAVLTILSGLRLMWISSHGFTPGYFQSPAGRTYSMCGGLAILGFTVAMGIGRPTQGRLAAAAAALGQASDEATRAKLRTRMAALQRRGTIANLTATVLGVIAACGMAVARYLG